MIIPGQRRTSKTFQKHAVENQEIAIEESSIEICESMNSLIMSSFDNFSFYVFTIEINCWASSNSEIW